MGKGADIFKEKKIGENIETKLSCVNNLYKMKLWKYKIVNISGANTLTIPQTDSTPSPTEVVKEHVPLDASLSTRCTCYA